MEPVGSMPHSQGLSNNSRQGWDSWRKIDELSGSRGSNSAEEDDGDDSLYSSIPYL